MNPYDREQFILKMTGSSAREKSFCQILSITFGIPRGRLPPSPFGIQTRRTFPARYPRRLPSWDTVSFRSLFARTIPSGPGVLPPFPPMMLKKARVLPSSDRISLFWRRIVSADHTFLLAAMAISFCISETALRQSLRRNSNS